MGKSPKFRREISDRAIQGLQGETLYKTRLLPDIKTGQVFPAIRADQTIDFYHGGGRLFTYVHDRKQKKHVFKTNVKFASVLLKIGRSNIVSEDDLRSGKANPVRDFSDVEGYERIKENCRLFAGEEAKGVACVCQASSYACCSDDVVVLDIEAAMTRQIDKNVATRDAQAVQKRHKVDRIDLVLYHRKQRVLRFYEAKCFVNPELWSRKGTPSVANQLDRYKAQLDRRAEEIVSAYQAYVRAIKLLFDTSAVEQMQEPVKIDTSGAVLLLFGYDKKQQPKIKELEKYGGMEGKLLRKRSSLSGATASLIWRAVQAL